MTTAAANGATVVFSSHQVGQVERAADRVAILKRGKLVVDRALDELKTDEKIIEAVFAGELPALGDLAADPRVVRIVCRTTPASPSAPMPTSPRNGSSPCIRATAGSSI